MPDDSNDSDDIQVIICNIPFCRNFSGAWQTGWSLQLRRARALGYQWLLLATDASWPKPEVHCRYEALEDSSQAHPGPLPGTLIGTPTYFFESGEFPFQLYLVTSHLRQVQDIKTRSEHWTVSLNSSYICNTQWTWNGRKSLESSWQLTPAQPPGATGRPWPGRPGPPGRFRNRPLTISNSLQVNVNKTSYIWKFPSLKNISISGDEKYFIAPGAGNEFPKAYSWEFGKNILLLQE